jgi:hypothetical protein
MPFLLSMFSVFGWIKRALDAVFDWAVKDIRNGIIIALGLATAIFWIGQYHEGHRADMASLRADNEAIAHARTVANYQAAAAQFEQDQNDNLDRVQLERSRALEGIQNAKNVADADWRARFDILRTRAAQADSSRYRKTGLPAPAAVAGQPAEADHYSGEPIGAGLVAVRVGDLETLVQNSIDGRAIQDFVIANEGVDNSPE